MSGETAPAEDNPDRGQTRDGNGRFIRDLDTATKDTLAAEMRTHGYPLREIAAKLGYANESGAAKAISRALRAVPAEAVEDLRALEVARMDALEERLWQILNTKYPLITPGVDLVQKGAYVEDPKPPLTVIDRLVRVSQQRARLLGLYAAPKPEEPEPVMPELTGGQIALLQRILEQIAPAAQSVPLRELLAGESETAGGRVTVTENRDLTDRDLIRRSARPAGAGDGDD